MPDLPKIAINEESKAWSLSWRSQAFEDPTTFFPAYDEEYRVIPTLEEAVESLDKHFGRGTTGKAVLASPTTRRHVRNTPSEHVGGYEIIVANDGSKDKRWPTCY
ncbi:Fc.00g024910.m01.CDS01 [Cosmosporella sp. VM-42]